MDRSDRNSTPHFSIASSMNEESAEGNVAEYHNNILTAETEETLTHVVATISESLQRLERLRDSVVELTDGSLPHGSRTPTPNSNVGPSHAAIVLSDATADTNSDRVVVPEMPRRSSTVPADIMERLLEYEDSIRPRVLSPWTERSSLSSPSNPMSQQPPADSLPLVASPAPSVSRAAPTSRPPPYPDLVIPPRRSWLGSSLSRVGDTSSDDDGSTALGRRVAARAAAGGMNTSESPASQLEQIFLSRTVEIARDLQGMTNLLRLRGAELLERSRARMGVSEHSPSANSNPSPSSFGRAIEFEGRVSTRMPPTRLRRTRIGQATSEADGVPEHADSTPPRPSVRSIAPTINARLRQILGGGDYLVRRRLNADGEEQVHNINLSDLVDDHEMGWPRPSIPPNAQGQPETRNRSLPYVVSRNMPPPPPPPPMRAYPGPRFSRVNTSQPTTDESLGFQSSIRTRRRGWARLDAYGEEIPTDEEDEVERRRVQSLVRSSPQVRPSNSSAAPTLSPLEFGAATRHTLVPVTRPSLAHPWDDNSAIIARVRINPPRQVDLPAFTDAFAPQYSTSLYQTSKSRRSFEPEPLPMPLADMIPSPALHTPNPRIINVHKYANLAGR